MPRFLLIALLLGPVLIAAEGPQPIPLPKLSGLVVDGHGDEWRDRGLHLTAFAESGSKPLDPAQARIEAQVAWTDAGLAVLVRMRSSAPWVESPRESTLFQADSVECFLRQGSKWANLVQVVVAPGMGGAHPELRLATWDYRGPAGAAMEPVTATAARTIHTDGVDIELLIPWTNLALTPAPGLGCEIMLKINKVLADGERRQWLWRGPAGEEFHPIELDGAAVASRQDRTAWVHLDDQAQGVAVAVLARDADAGSTVHIEGGSQGTVTATLMPDGGRSLAWLTLPARWSGIPITVRLDETAIGGGSTPALASEWRDALLLTARRNEVTAGSREARLRPDLPSLLLGPELPQATMPDPTAAALAGVRGITTTWYDADGAPISRAERVGRLGAIITIDLGDDDPIHIQRTAFRVGAEQADGVIAATATALAPEQPILAEHLRRRLFDRLGTDAQLASLLAAIHEIPSDMAARPAAQDRAWWHRLRTTLGTQTVYSYHRLLPPGYDDDAERRWPAILYLHGSGGRLPRDYQPLAGRDPNRDLHGWARGRGDIPFAIYSLQSFGGWEPPAVIDALERILASDRIDPDRVILMGFSMGGMGTWATAVDYPERWAAVVPLAGRGAFAAEAARVRQLPIWVFNGEDDRTTTLADAQVMVDAVRAVAGDIRLTVFPGVGHGIQNPSFETPGLWEWLSERRRPASSTP